MPIIKLPLDYKLLCVITSFKTSKVPPIIVLPVVESILNLLTLILKLPLDYKLP